MGSNAADWVNVDQASRVWGSVTAMRSARAARVAVTR
jgi:hypothetical protein